MNSALEEKTQRTDKRRVTPEVAFPISLKADTGRTLFLGEVTPLPPCPDLYLSPKDTDRIRVGV